MRSVIFQFLLVLLAGIRLVSADDTELFVSTRVQTPNILLLFDTSGSMCAVPPANDSGVSGACARAGTRDKLARDSIISFITSTENANISVMSFNTSPKSTTVPGPSGARVNFASANVDNSSNKSAIVDVLDNDIDIIANRPTSTPLSESLYEAYLYFAGLAPRFGASGVAGQESVPGALDGSNYLSPIEQACQRNSIVVITDGQPSDDFRVNSEIQNLISTSSLILPADLDVTCVSAASVGRDGCIDELSWYIQNHDVNATFPGDQNINVHAVSVFSASEDVMDRTATHGGGSYYFGSDVSGLSSVFSDLNQIVIQGGAGLAVPASSVDAFSSLETSEEIYYVVFTPDAGPAWRGNLKRYRLGNDNQIYDADDNLAIDSSTGFFTDTAKSFWSSSADGATVEAGGMAENISASRSVYTNISGYSNVDLTGNSNKLHETNTTITAAMLGAADTVETESILQWARGVDVDDEDDDGSNTDNRTSIGDPLHTQPKVINYFADETSSPTVDDRTVYFTTNDGFLHAVNTDDGSTEFSFIPRHLLGNLKIYRDGESLDGRTKIYGLDGPMTTWIYDKNQDGDLLQSNNGSADTGEHAYLYLTMRRGGNNIYALDVTDRTGPELKWVIAGDRDNDHITDATGPFARLGQTWSAVKLTTVLWKGNQQAVLLFGGGYDPEIDGFPSTIVDNNIGNAIFMVDAETGSLLWTASSSGEDLNISDMKYSIPAELALVDFNGDGVTDYFFAADAGGQVLRFDIDENNTGATNFAAGGVIAKLSGSSDSTSRRFFEGPVAAISRDYDAIHIVVGSGFRPSPFSSGVNDRMYVIRDTHVDQAPGSYTYASLSVIDESDLYDATDNKIQDGTTAERTAAQSSLDSANGWYLALEGSGEKSLSKPDVFNGILLFTTFTPNTPTPGECGPLGGQNFLYAVNIENGASVIDFDTSSSSPSLDKSDRKRALIQKTSIAPSPSILNRDNQGYEICVGSECFQNTLRSLGSVPLIRGLWRENR